MEREICWKRRLLTDRGLLFKRPETAASQPPAPGLALSGALDACVGLTCSVCALCLRGFYDCVSVPLTSLIWSPLPSSSCPSPNFSSHLSSPASGCPCLTLINSKCKNHLSTAPFPPSPAGGWGQRLLSSHRLSALRPLWFMS